MNNMYYTYVLWSSEDKRFYIGYTTNLKRRLCEHKNDQVYSTSRLADLKLIFYEAFVSRKDAVRREQYFKTTKGKKALRLILRNSIVEVNNCRVV